MRTFDMSYKFVLSIAHFFLTIISYFLCNAFN